MPERYIPAPSSAEPQLKSYSSRRARLWAGGTYFRSREVGRSQNKISVQVIENSGPETAEPDAVCIVTNHNIDKSENIIGPVTAVFLSHKMNWDHYIKIDANTLRAQYYSISSKIGSGPTLVQELGNLAFSQVFNVDALLSTKLIQNTSETTSSSEIIIRPRFRMYRLEVITVTVPPPADDPSATATEVTGWDIAKLRQQMDSDPWIEMLERSGPTPDPSGGPPTPNPNPADVQDDAIDALVLTPFAEQFLSGGDGLPDTPINEVTGPSKALIHVNYGEAQNGSLAEVNVIYEWVGTSASEGEWVRYS